jgi:hypothetical protein
MTEADAQCHILSVNEPKKKGARSERAQCSVKTHQVNSVYIWYLIIKNKVLSASTRAGCF